MDTPTMASNLASMWGYADNPNTQTGLVLSDHFDTRDWGGYQGFDYHFETAGKQQKGASKQQKGKLVISSGQNCCERFTSYILFEGVTYLTAKEMPLDVVGRIKQLIITHISHVVNKFKDDWDEYGNYIELKFTAFAPGESVGDGRFPSDLYLIASNDHNGYYPHEVIATYNNNTHSTRI